MSDSTSSAYHPTRPPSLNYSTSSGRRRLWISLFFVLIFIEAAVLPLILFYAIRWGAHLSNTTNLAIITSVVGTYSSYKFAFRSWHLFVSDRGHQRRPIGAGRFGPDAFTYVLHLSISRPQILLRPVSHFDICSLNHALLLSLALTTETIGCLFTGLVARPLFISYSPILILPLPFDRIQISIAMTAFFAPLIVGSSLNPASVHIVAMSLSCFMIVFCFPLLITSLWPHKLKMPFRVSSMPPWTGLPPAVYTIVEDIVAVDGGGCVEFRQAWRIRYEHSAIMRHVIRVTSFSWGASGCAVAAALIAIAWTTSDDVGYGLGWGIPWAWAIFSAAVTVPWVKKELRREREEWDRPGVHVVLNLHIRQTADEEKVAREVGAQSEAHRRV